MGEGVRRGSPAAAPPPADRPCAAALLCAALQNKAGKTALHLLAEITAEWEPWACNGYRAMLALMQAGASTT